MRDVEYPQEAYSGVGGLSCGGAFGPFFEVMAYRGPGFFRVWDGGRLS